MKLAEAGEQIQNKEGSSFKQVGSNSMGSVGIKGMALPNVVSTDDHQQMEYHQSKNMNKPIKNVNLLPTVVQATNNLVDKSFHPQHFDNHQIYPGSTIGRG